MRDGERESTLTGCTYERKYEFRKIKKSTHAVISFLFLCCFFFFPKLSADYKETDLRNNSPSSAGFRQRRLHKKKRKKKKQAMEIFLFFV